MGAIANEPSMEEILSSIKRIIADEDAAAGQNRGGRRRIAPRSAPPAEAGSGQDEGGQDEESVLELTEPLATDPSPPPAPPAAPPATPRPAATPAAPVASEAEPAPVLSPESAVAARESLSHLSAAVEQREAAYPGGQTIDALVRELLTPMLREWLDRQLPGMVEQMVQREIDRITAGLRK